MASKRRNMFYENKKQETTEIGGVIRPRLLGMTRAVRDPGPSPVLLFLLVVGLVPTVHPSTLVLLSQPQPEEPLRTKTESRIRPRRDTVERHAGLPLILKGAREPDTNSFPFQGRHFPTCSQRPKMKVQTDGNGALTMHAENGTKVPMGRVEIIPDSKLLRVVPGTRYKVGAIRIPKDGVVLKSEKIHDINKTTPSLRKNEANGMNMRVSVWPDKVGADIRDRKVGGGSTRDPYPERRNIRETDGRRLRMRDEQIGEEQVKRRFSDRNKRMIGERINVKNSMRESRESDEIGLRIVGKRRRSIGPPAPHKGVEGSPFIRPKQDIEVLTGHDRFKKHNINGAETADHGHLRRLVPREDFSTTDSLMEKNNNNSSMKKRLIEVGNKYKSRKYKYENSAAQENNPSDGDRTVLKYTYELRKETGKHSSLRGNSYRPERKAKLERSVGGPEGNLMENGNQLLKDSVIRVDFKEDYNVKTADEEYVDRRITNTDVSVIASEPMRNNVGFNQRTAPKFVLCCSHENGRDPTLSDSMKSAHASESGEQGLPNFRGEDGGFERLTQSNASVRSSSKPVEEQDVLSGLNRKRRSAPKSTPRKCGDADVNSRVGFLRDRRLKLFSTSGDCEQRGARPAFSKPSPAMLLATTGSSPLEGDEALWKFLHELRGLSKKGGRKKSSSRMSHDYPDYLQDQAPEGREEVGGGVVSILGLFELSQWGAPRPEGLQELAAAQLAVEHVNEHQLLGPATLKLVTNDTKVSSHKLSSIG
ncbi:hypothetical protein AAG570_004045 [Ranatra chinensis]|uniref:Uncharacterized protein n=1 Tax=Ranatra chinensis TaxID=642074 RepID=A0ABD0Y4W9_9HEMI